MMANYINWGEPINAIPEELASSELAALLRACEAHPHFDIVGLRLIQAPVPHIGVVADVGDGTVAPQNSPGIWPRERLCLSFCPGLMVPAEVRALRTDFPDVIHLNGVPDGEPASLCLYESWGFEERQWTAERHLRKVLWWLASTADGTIHAQDQALEQLFYSSGDVVVLPSDWDVEKKERLYLNLADESAERRYWLAGTKATDGAPRWQVAVLDLPPIGHQPIQRSPSTLGALDDQLTALGSDLSPDLSEALKSLSRLSNQTTACKLQLLLLLRIPRLRDGKIDRWDARAYAVAAPWEDVGIELGVLGRSAPNAKAYAIDLLGGPVAALSEEGRAFKLAPLEVLQTPPMKQARAMSGIEASRADFRGTLAGVGSLGSALANLWARSQWGRWNLIDPDQVAPHNVVRHEANAIDIGLKKVDVIRGKIDAVFARPILARAVYASASDFDAPEVESCLRESALLVDASTTLSVPRDWSEHDLARSASVFFTHSGLASVLMLEDEHRCMRLSALEAQYYRALLHEPWGQKHLHTAAQIRVGAGCRDHSFVLSHELVQLHAAQLSRALRQGVLEPNARIEIRTHDENSGAVSVASIAVRPVRSLEGYSWKVRWDEGLEDQMLAMRSACLPVETGGVLLGIFDHKVRTVTIVDAREAPLDSVAHPDSFIRGRAGVPELVEHASSLTRGMVGYIGEWHSHPPGVRAVPSALDKELLAKLESRLREDGLPAIMAIVAENEVNVFVGGGEVAETDDTAARA